jgi:hypothetical protein
VLRFARSVLATFEIRPPIAGQWVYIARNRPKEHPVCCVIARTTLLCRFPTTPPPSFPPHQVYARLSSSASMAWGYKTFTAPAHLFTTLLESLPGLLLCAGPTRRVLFRNFCREQPGKPPPPRSGIRARGRIPGRAARWTLWSSGGRPRQGHPGALQRAPRFQQSPQRLM